MENPKIYDICVIGAIVVDFIFEVPHFPKEGEAMAADNFFTSAGGGVFNSLKNRLTKSRVLLKQLPLEKF